MVKKITPQDNIARGKLSRATEYRQYGGILPYLCKEYDGVREFVYEELIKKKIPPAIFLQDLVRKFPKIPKKHLPSTYAVRDYVTKVIPKLDITKEFSKSTAIALSGEAEALKCIEGFHIIERRKKLIDRIEDLMEKAQKALDCVMNLMNDSQQPPENLFRSVELMANLIDREANHLIEMDKLMVRMGLMPPMPKDININQNNFNLNNGGEGEPFNGVLTDDIRERMKIRFQQIDWFVNRKPELDTFLDSYPEATLEEKEPEKIKKK